MKIAQVSNTINFSGIKNVGYARVIKKADCSSRTAMTMELTDDDKNEDLTNYRTLLYQHPEFIHPINPNYLTFELITKKDPSWGPILMGKVNGMPFSILKQNVPMMNFIEGLTSRIEKQKEKDFVVDPDQHLMDEAQKGLFIGEENLDSFMDGTEGELDLLSGTGLIEKFDLYLNTIPEASEIYEPEDSIEEDELNSELAEIDEKVKQAMDDVVSILYHPAYVKSQAPYFNALVKGYSEVFKPDVNYS